jgi:hypothetical protein
METLHLYERKSHHYRDGWSGLDRHDFVATVKVTPPKMVREPEGYDDGGVYIMHARAPRGTPNLKRALQDSLSNSGCKHEYDCCGCAATYARVTKVSARDYIVRSTVSYNY